MKNNNFDFNTYSSVNVDLHSFSECIELLERMLVSDVEISPQHINQEVILYGAGNLGKMAKHFFKYLNMPFLYFVDRNAESLKSHIEWKGIDIIHPSKVKDEDKKNCLLILCIVATPLIPLRDILKSDGWENITFFYDVCEAYVNSYPLYNGWFLKKQNENERNSIKDVFSALDEVSRKHYLQFIAWRRLRIELLFKDIKREDNRYFIKEVLENLSENEVFVDCGAHNGSISKKFIELTNGEYNSIVAIEGDNENFVKLEDNLKNIPRTNTIRMALSDKIGRANFYQGFDYASKLNDLGNISVEISTIDELNIPATFIKMHLEGAELSSLWGAIETIKKYRPIIAVTIYHNPDGLFEIPLYLIKNTRDYRFSLRLDSWGGTGAVFYAIPEERYKKVIV